MSEQAITTKNTLDKVRRLRQLIVQLSVVIAIIALVQQLRRPPDERSWHGNVFGVPYDFRRPSPGRMQKAWWNPNDQHLLTPRDFGIGWAVNLHRLLQLLRHDPKQSGAD